MNRYITKSFNNKIFTNYANSLSLKFNINYTQNYVYHFYVDFKGLMYFDDDTTPFIFPNAIKDKKFIEFFYKNIRKIQEDSSQRSSNITKKYDYLSQFWGQKNYLRCAIAPIIFNYLNNQTKQLQFSLGQKSKFDPYLIKIDENGLFWHPYIQSQSSLSFSNKKKNKQTNQQKKNIFLKGVFSNELTCQILQNVILENNKMFFKYNNQIIKIEKLTQNMDKIII